ncbi:alpha/beta hydrolase [Amycolatopsis lurida]
MRTCRWLVPLVVALVATGTPAVADVPRPECRQVSAPVSVAPGQPLDQRIAGTLCLPRSRTTTVQLLMPGGYYGQEYWAVRGNPGKPSYVETMQRAGYATLAIDRLGAGRSSRPPSERFAAQTHRDTMWQVIRQLRTGRLAGQPFDRVILAGHSFSSPLAESITLAYPQDVDGIIYTGAGSKQNYAEFARLEAEGIHRANQDPMFGHLGLDDGYLTTKPGTRPRWMTYGPTTAPSRIALDEAMKEPDVLPGYDAFPGLEDKRRITVPVLIVIGQRDILMCAPEALDCSSSQALMLSEGPWYGPRARLETASIPNTGHSLNLHLTAPVWNEIARSWMDRHFGR